MEDKGPFATSAGNNFVTWFLQLFTSKTIFRLIFIADLLHSEFFERYLVELRGPFWTMHVMMQHGVHLSDSVHRASSKTSLAMGKAPLEVEGWLGPVHLGYKTVFSQQHPALDWGLQVVL